jgi:iron(III) transport system substrate-binding protein
MKKTALYVLMLLITLMLLVPQFVLAQNDTVVVYSPWADPVMNELAEMFKEETGYTLKNVNISTGEIFARLQVEQGNPQADVWHSVRALYLDEAKEKGLIRSFEAPENAKYMLESYTYPGKDYIIGTTMYPLVFAYNTEYLSELGYEAPENWDDLLEPKWADKIVMPHPATSGTAFAMLATVIEMYQQDDETGIESELGWEYIENLSKNIGQYTRSGTTPSLLTARGEYPLAVQFYDRIYRMQNEGYPIKAVFPEPIYAAPSCSALIADSPNPEGGDAFLNFMLSKKAQEIVKKEGNYSVRTDVNPPEGARPLSELVVFEDDYSWAAENKNDMLAKFLQVAH